MTSMQEILVIIVIGLLLFNWRKLPDLAGSIGKAMTSFKRGLSEPEEVEVGAPKPSNAPADQEKAAGPAAAPAQDTAQAADGTSGAKQAPPAGGEDGATPPKA
ncbi:twin arginine-targeting protein translocase, TatA/E family [Humidesulfovibrio mexicanus]|jgi:sec-independent protein translocase protein TatA|uniref:Sec-independent protein translocase protein TatA n=1 Tax=Humidesulfovibrio mexicanus TaxID=147047 RepID=A0A239CK32_9BACT|nr:twin-arginine translocase TatA/TatE family subunit [Humidesulfovibrio mexicanus]SNS20299.1 twin arginine-targeting protein translocase, TatA/E family [Humidesulfovibrio mexicanus]